MRIDIQPETPDRFTTRLAALLVDDGCHVYFDTSFLMWLIKLSATARAQFVEWADTLGDRTHVPLWAMHEFYRHHTARTLKSNIGRLADAMTSSAVDFQSEMKRYSDQQIFVGASEDAYQNALNDALASLKKLGDAAKTWDYETAAREVVDWINARACKTLAVFDSMPSLMNNGAARYTQDLPPGFMDRKKKDKPLKGSNKYGDLLFWQEVVMHAKSRRASSVVIVTTDRKEDWYLPGAAPEPEPDWQRLKSKWNPVPQPHPTLAFELKIETRADLVLLDELYLGALLWKSGRPRFERLAAAAINVTFDHFATVDRGTRTIAERAAKRREQPSIGLKTAGSMVDAAVDRQGQEAHGLLSKLDGTAPDADAFVAGLDAAALNALGPEQAACFCSCLHDRAKAVPGPARTAVGKLLGMLDRLPADAAAATYIGFACSAYFDGRKPLAAPDGPFVQDLLAWETDTALVRVLDAFDRRMTKVGSAALYRPDGKAVAVTLRFEHDADQQQDPVVLSQVYLGSIPLLTDDDPRQETWLQTILRRKETTVRDIAQAVCRHYGLPEGRIAYKGAEGDDYRLLKRDTGFREFDRFTDDEEDPDPAFDPENGFDDEEEHDGADANGDGGEYLKDKD